MVTLMHYTPLSVCAHAVRTCWQSFERSDNGGPKDLALIDKVGNKYKHASTLEHLRLGFMLTNGEYPQVRAFKEDPFSEVTQAIPFGAYTVSTNLRALQNIDIPEAMKREIVPDEYKYLLREGGQLPKDLGGVGLHSWKNTGQLASLMYCTNLALLREVAREPEVHLYYTFYIQDISRALLQELARHRIASLSVKSTRYTLKELGKVENIRPTDWWAVGQFCVLTGNVDVDAMIGMALAAVQDLIKNGVSNDIAKFALPDAYKTELTWTINARSLQNFLNLRTASSAMWEIRRLAYAIHPALPEDHKYLYADYVHAT